MEMLVVGIVMARHDVGALCQVIASFRQFIKKVPDNGSDFIPTIIRHRA